MDNIILTVETIHSIKAKKFKGMIIKLDFCQAYDYINLEFRLLVLNRLGFDSGWLEGIQTCIFTPRFSLNVNGSLNGFF